jgi:hypothetical protein
MSFDAGNPFQSMGSAKPQEPSLLPKIIVVLIVLFVLFVGGIILAVKMKPISGGLAEAFKSKENAGKMTEKELWAEFADDEPEATQKFGGRWMQVSGECSDVAPFRPDGSALNEQYSVQMGHVVRQFNEEWRVDCYIPRQNMKPFDRVKQGGTLTVLGRVKGRNRDNQVIVEDCEFVSFSTR